MWRNISHKNRRLYSLVNEYTLNDVVSGSTYYMQFSEEEYQEYLKEKENETSDI